MLSFCEFINASLEKTKYNLIKAIDKSFYFIEF